MGGLGSREGKEKLCNCIITMQVSYPFLSSSTEDPSLSLPPTPVPHTSLDLCFFPFSGCCSILYFSETACQAWLVFSLYTMLLNFTQVVLCHPGKGTEAAPHSLPHDQCCSKHGGSVNHISFGIEISSLLGIQ